MKKTIIISLMFSVLLAASCTKEESYSREAGDVVEFVADAYPCEDVLAATKVSYGSNYTESSVNYVRVNWTNNDKLTLYCAECENTTLGYPASFNYTVTDVNTTGGAKITHDVSSTGLRWDKNGTYHFYGMYPTGTVGKTATVKVAASQTPKSSNTTSGNVTLVPDCKNLYMTTKADVNKTASVDAPALHLDFVPLNTVVELILQNDYSTGEAMLVKSVSLSSTSTPLAGTFSANLEGQTGRYPACTVTTGTSSVKTSTLVDSNPVSIAYGKTLTLDLFLAPTDVTDLTLTIETQTGGTRVFRLKKSGESGAYITLSGHKKHTIKGLLVPEQSTLIIDGSVVVTEWVEDSTAKKTLQ